MNVCVCVHCCKGTPILSLFFSPVLGRVVPVGAHAHLNDSIVDVDVLKTVGAAQHPATLATPHKPVQAPHISPPTPTHTSNAPHIIPTTPTTHTSSNAPRSAAACHRSPPGSRPRWGRPSSSRAGPIRTPARGLVLFGHIDWLVDWLVGRSVGRLGRRVRTAGRRQQSEARGRVRKLGEPLDSIRFDSVLINSTHTTAPPTYRDWAPRCSRPFPRRRRRRCRSPPAAHSLLLLLLLLLPRLLRRRLSSPPSGRLGRLAGWLIDRSTAGRPAARPPCGMWIVMRQLESHVTALGPNR